MSARRRFAGETGGVSALEFALTAPIFFALICGIVEIGMALFTQFGIENGVEAAARCASVNTTACADADSIKTYAADNAWGLTIPASAFTISTPDCGNLVQASYDFAFFTLFFGTPTVTLTAQSCFPK